MYSGLVRHSLICCTGLCRNYSNKTFRHNTPILNSKQLKTFCQRQGFTWSQIKYAKNDAAAGAKNAKSKPRPKTSELKRLIQVARKEKWKIAGAVCFLLVSSTVQLSVPFCMGKVIDIINTSAHDGTLMEKLTNFSAILLVIFIIGGLANFGRAYLMNISAQNIMMRMRHSLYASILKQEVGFFDKNKTGELISRLSNDTAMIGQSVTSTVADGLIGLCRAVGSLAMMTYVSPKLAMIALCIVPPIATWSIVYGRFTRKISKECQDALASATSVAEEKIGNIRTVRAFAKENQEIEMYNNSLQKVLQLAYKQALATSVFWGMNSLSGNVFVLAVFYAGGYMSSQSMISVGELTSFLLYAIYTGISMNGLSTCYTDINKSLGASTRVWQLTDRVPQVPLEGGLVPATPLIGKIDFRNVTFNYPNRVDSQILSDFNLSMPAGSMTAVVGASGSGKSTIGSLLMRYYDPVNGGVYLDEENLTSLNPEWLRNQIGVVSQEPALFSCSIADNIRYGSLDPSSVTMEMIEDASRQAFADNFICNFPQKYDTFVGERGLMLSGGQKQRIALARAIIKNPKILLLDEATSALDSESEHYVKQALNRLMVGRTVVTIAHRLSTIKGAHQIVVLHKGRVAELGTYEQLTTMREGIFRKLVEKQTIQS